MMNRFLRLITIYTKLEIVGSLILVGWLFGYTVCSLNSPERSPSGTRVTNLQK
ncbi:hypothetical protein IQ255_10080 [Pleurocapsales cyanobacterium LEGE 10410]|nr:hypothetical protein [Pleurocapsales cyanobacterium LEGE 10410]